MELISNYPWYYTLLCLIVGFVFSALLYFRDKQNAERSKSLLYSLAALRFISISVLCLLLLDIFIKRIVNEVEKPVIIIAQDNSASLVANKDSLDIKTTYTTEIQTLISSLKENFDVKTYQFDSESKPSETFDFKGKETDISKALNDIENNYVNKNIGAIILASDGIYNKGKNPIYDIKKLNAPIYSIALGDTTALKDVWIQAVNHNQIAYLGNTFPVEVIINAIDLKNEEVTISISHKGKTIQSKNISITSENFSNTIQFVIDADKPGVQTYQVNVTLPKNDKNKFNNSFSFIVDVIDNREKILILANAPHPDISAIEQSIASLQTYEVEIALAAEFTKPLKPYALIITHQTALLPTRLTNEIKANNQSVLCIGNDVMNPITGVNIKRLNDSRKNDVEAVYRKDFTLFTISTELQNFLKDLPAVKCNFANTVSGNTVNSLLTQKIGLVETDYPLLYFTEINSIKLGAFVGDGLWRWRMRDYVEHENQHLFNELISKTVQYLSVKADKSFFRVHTKKIINENEPIEFNAEVYNQSYELTTEPEVQLQLKDENGKTYDYIFTKKQNMYYLPVGRFSAGEYSYEARVKYGEKLFVKSGIITVKEIVSEKINTVANHQLLYQMANESGGQLVYRNQIQQLASIINSNQNITSITYSHRQLTDLVQLKWLFFFILLLLSIEWFLRKYNGKV